MILFQKESVKLANIWMIQKRLYLNLSYQLLHNAFLFEHFRHSFQSKNKICFNMPC